MKILLISPGIYPNTIGGMEIYNYHFVNEMIKLKQDVSLLTRDGKGITCTKKFKLYTGNSFLHSLQIINHLIFHKYDIVHIPYTSNSTLATPIFYFKKFNGKFKYIIYIHGGGMQKWNKPKIHKVFFEKAKEVIAISDPMVYEYSKRVNKKIKKILPLIPFELPTSSKSIVRRKIGFNEKDKILIYVGSLKPIKGSDFLVNSFIKLGKEFFKKYNIKMIFIGDGVLKEELEQNVKKNLMSNEIIFLGKKKREEIPDYLTAADIYVNASHFEGAPLSIIEAIFRGLIVISTNVSGINNLIRDRISGFLFEKENFDSFKSSLIELLTNKTLQESIALKVKEDVINSFSYKNCFIQHLELYK